MNKFGPSVAMVLLVFFFLAACSPAQQNYLLGTPLPSATETLISEFALTAQTGQVQAGLTKSAAEAKIAGLNADGTQVAIQLTSSVATEQYFSRQTQTAGTSTAAANATATAVQNDNLTQTAVANQNAINASDTQVAKTQTAVPAQATATAIWYAGQADDRQNRSEENTLLFTTWAYRVVLVTIFIVGLVFAIFGGKALYEARYAILAYFGVVRWGADGKPYMIAPVKGGFHVWDPSRALEPGMTIIAADHQLTTSGGAEDKTQQLRLAEHAQTIELQLAENTLPLAPHAGLSSAQPGQSLALTPTASVPAQQFPGSTDVKILVIDPDHQKIQSWVDEATQRIIDGEVRDIE